MKAVARKMKKGSCERNSPAVFFNKTIAIAIA
jgi:hypothetical protein